MDMTTDCLTLSNQKCSTKFYFHVIVIFWLELIWQERGQINSDITLIFAVVLCNSALLGGLSYASKVSVQKIVIRRQCTVILRMKSHNRCECSLTYRLMKIVDRKFRVIDANIFGQANVKGKRDYALTTVMKYLLDEAEGGAPLKSTLRVVWHWSFAASDSVRNWVYSLMQTT